jgi:hypothetical protein
MLRRRRTGEKVSKVAEMKHRDAVETLRRRLVNATDEALASIERRQRRNKESVPWAEFARGDQGAA